ncbi:hypothetical protein F5888DRAFT_433212 [Russula emetica]|nr:hypothetical protein F5888DRAFT_433212 [Russula emetica]
MKLIWERERVHSRVPTGRVIFEIGGAPVREELARDALRQAGDKLPTLRQLPTSN